MGILSLLLFMKYIDISNNFLLLSTEFQFQLGSFWFIYDDSFPSLFTDETLSFHKKSVQIYDNLEHLAEDVCVSLLL